ncbi:hypothetical protein KFE25_001472 [Diacronema lutheri]|uniref:Peroxin-14 n=1 Tax=Diacronema lutheri TaxID=2081491 RepID=A0A8J6C3S0_DIALT|nr:hypothetical protein KFE25_001472 [Diacronema lutheri]
MDLAEPWRLLLVFALGLGVGSGLQPVYEWLLAQLERALKADEETRIGTPPPSPTPPLRQLSPPKPAPRSAKPPPPVRSHTERLMLLTQSLLGNAAKLGPAVATRTFAPPAADERPAPAEARALLPGVRATGEPAAARVPDARDKSDAVVAQLELLLEHRRRRLVALRAAADAGGARGGGPAAPTERV